ncbi:MAG: hypothetical protein IPP40_09425 [bacterium]|nr:hypothetical protein [bacterium]
MGNEANKELQIMDKEQKLDRLGKQKQEMQSLASADSASPEFQKWHRNTRVLLGAIFGLNSTHVGEFESIRFTPKIQFGGSVVPDNRAGFSHGLQRASALLESLIDETEHFHEDDKQPAS